MLPNVKHPLFIHPLNNIFRNCNSNKTTSASLLFSYFVFALSLFCCTFASLLFLLSFQHFILNFLFSFKCFLLIITSFSSLHFRSIVVFLFHRSCIFSFRFYSFYCNLFSIISSLTFGHFTIVFVSCRHFYYMLVSIIYYSHFDCSTVVCLCFRFAVFSKCIVIVIWKFFYVYFS